MYDPTETATRWQQLTVRIRQAAATEATRRELQAKLGKLIDDREYLDRRLRTLAGELRDWSSGLSRISATGRRQRRQLTAQLDQLIQRRENVGGQIDELRHQLSKLGAPTDIDRWVDERDQLRVTLDAVATHNGRHHERRPQDHLVDLLGRPPEDPEARVLWRDAAHQIEAFRIRWQIDGPHRALGDPIADGAQADDRRRLSWQLRDTVREIHELEHPERAITRSRGLSR